jgi:formate dehydrogenase subunit gamma
MKTLIKRYSFMERATHWGVAASFLYAAFTGLALWSHELYWLASVFGGGVTTRVTHPWAGVIFAGIFAVMFWNWARQMRLDREDQEWLKQSHKYAMNEEEGLPEPGRFNAGQKMLFWLQFVAAMALFASGVVLWLPEVMPRPLRLAAIVLHPAAGVSSVALIILHVYMGAAAVPGALKAMVRGEVTEGWLRAHHPKVLR